VKYNQPTNTVLKGVRMSSPITDVTQLLRAWSEGDESALEKLTPLVYQELHRLAHQYMKRERTDHTLQTTALVNEAYLRLARSAAIEWRDRAHFFAVSAQAMRRILVDMARARGYAKRGGGARHVGLDQTAVMSSPEAGADLLALDEAIAALSAVDGRKARVVELRFFGGLSVEETAAVLNVSTDTVMRDWSLAKVWLLQKLSEPVTADVK
jgi:RNA polymerase sigma-70 factor (ECF subfamily)